MNPLADVTENEWPRVFRCTESMSGWNYDGSSKHKPHMVSDLFNERTYWIEFWEKITGRKRKDTICSYEGCTNRLLVGGHIWLSKQAGSPYKWCYIAPICQTCNNKRLEPDRELGSGSHLKKGTLVVRIRKPEDETEVNTDEILSGMNKLKVDTEPPAPPHCASNSYFESRLVFSPLVLRIRCINLPRSAALCVQLLLSRNPPAKNPRRKTLEQKWTFFVVI